MTNRNLYEIYVDVLKTYHQELIDDWNSDAKASTDYNEGFFEAVGMIIADLELIIQHKLPSPPLMMAIKQRDEAGYVNKDVLIQSDTSDPGPALD